MVSEHTRSELEEYIGQVPSFIEALPESAADHAWGMMRDLELSETDLPTREKALVGLGAAAAIQCPYCVHFHRAESKMEGVTDDELSEAIGVASTVRYFSTVLHGTEIDMDEFERETAEIVEYVEQQQAAPGDD
ncbi:carboxymuconolactone decarboxylase family protein [Halorubellus sp. JP-L1]|uniref:carboxymuconolactone decarboxylase family protein n=1 Tax=Halorubellus sp. JP-L1 TaxID=2715753 RepID=UPI00140A0F2A|nr:carboxymuconolactone decarboxylase family protein [Halorubellus sp. JP-L1]NHN40645.1 carboxymuconolactone decarboxylase family protein [Halorubellus sp. JP-L1]